MALNKKALKRIWPSNLYECFLCRILLVTFSVNKLPILVLTMVWVEGDR